MLFVVIPSMYLMFGCLLRLNSNLAVANRVDAAVVTKTETVTIGECPGRTVPMNNTFNMIVIVSHLIV